MQWNEDENNSKERQDETKVKRESVHGDSDNAPFTRRTTNLKWSLTLNIKDTEPFCNFQGPSHFPVVLQTDRSVRCSRRNKYNCWLLSMKISYTQSELGIYQQWWNSINTGVHIQMGTVDRPTSECYFNGECACTIRQATSTLSIRNNIFICDVMAYFLFNWQGLLNMYVARCLR